MENSSSETSIATCSKYTITAGRGRREESEKKEKRDEQTYFIWSENNSMETIQAEE
jgi:hypothetical protein